MSKEVTMLWKIIRNFHKAELHFSLKQKVNQFPHIATNKPAHFHFLNICLVSLNFTELNLTYFSSV